MVLVCVDSFSTYLAVDPHCVLSLLEAVGALFGEASWVPGFAVLAYHSSWVSIMCVALRSHGGNALDRVSSPTLVDPILTLKRLK